LGASALELYDMNAGLVLPRGTTPPAAVTKKADDFLRAFVPYELGGGGNVHLFLDERSKAFYLTCHLPGVTLAESCDSDATLDVDEDDEIYKLNRDIQEDQAAYQVMEQDARNGRSFEDLVLEYDTSYTSKRPLKVYGGQHRLQAISKAKADKPDTLHGVRVYFALSREQKVEIATINNTAIAVPNDLLDRMKEQLLGSELRDWCQAVSLLEEGFDFADRRKPDTPTVRLARTLLVNFFLGKEAPKGSVPHQPVLCKAGGVDEEYLRVRGSIDWADPSLMEMGKQFVRLHKKQKETVSNRDEDSNAEFARKALSLAVVASWAYAAGVFQADPTSLANLYSLPDNTTSPEDPLNAKALSQARLKGTDPENYRGLGTRNSPKELGRMLEVFLVLAEKGKEKGKLKITKQLANAAIQAYEAKRAVYESVKELAKI
jgi:hypothetical protein